MNTLHIKNRSPLATGSPAPLAGDASTATPQVRACSPAPRWPVGFKPHCTIISREVLIAYGAPHTLATAREPNGRAGRANVQGEPQARQNTL